MDIKKMCLIQLYIIGVTIVDNLVCCRRSTQISDNRKIVPNRYTFRRSHLIGPKNISSHKLNGVGHTLNQDGRKFKGNFNVTKSPRLYQRHPSPRHKATPTTKQQAPVKNMSGNFVQTSNDHLPSKRGHTLHENYIANDTIFSSKSQDITLMMDPVASASSLQIASEDTKDIFKRNVGLSTAIKDTIAQSLHNEGIYSSELIRPNFTKLLRIFINPKGNISRISRNYTKGDHMIQLLKEIDESFNGSKMDRTIRMKKNSPLRFGLDFSEIEKNDTTLRPDTTTLRPDTTTLRPDTTTLRPDTTTLRPDTTKISSSTERPESTITVSPTEDTGNITTFSATENGTSYITNIFNAPLTIYAFLTGK